MNKIGLVIILSLFFASLACNFNVPQQAAPAQPDLQATVNAMSFEATTQAGMQGQVATFVAQTAAALPPPAVVTNPPAAPEATSTTESTATPAPTETPSVPMISVTTNTNCRLGPGPEYGILGALVVGEKVPLLGKNNTGDWWYIENPQKPGENCWVWGQHAQIEGETAALPIITPPPTYKFSFATIADCEGHAAAAFNVQNIGSLTYQSGSITVNVAGSNDFPPFTPRIDNALFQPGPNTCGSPQSALGPGETKSVAVGLAIGAVKPASGTKMVAEVSLCTKDDMAGTCITKTISFTMP